MTNSLREEQKGLVKSISNGDRNGEYFYICDIRVSQDSAFNKPIRKVIPQKVFCRSNDELGRNKTIYYSKSHFVGLNKKGEPLRSKVIGLFDNTGYRSYTGIPVLVFNTMDECEKAYSAQIKEIVNDMNAEIKKSKRIILNFKKENDVQ